MRAQEDKIRRHAYAWVGLTLILGIHVADEAVHDFLSFYNPFVMSLRDMLLWTWLPTFQFATWLGGLVVAISALLSMAWFAMYGARWMAWASLPFGLLMLANGLAHILGSIYLQRVLPGTYSAPLLLIGSVWLLVTSIARLRA